MDLVICFHEYKHPSNYFAGNISLYMHYDLSSHVIFDTKNFLHENFFLFISSFFQQKMAQSRVNVTNICKNGVECHFYYKYVVCTYYHIAKAIFWHLHVVLISLLEAPTLVLKLKFNIWIYRHHIWIYFGGQFFQFKRKSTGGAGNQSSVWLLRYE